MLRTELAEQTLTAKHISNAILTGGLLLEVSWIFRKLQRPEGVKN